MARITVEDCLEVVDNRFELVLMATKRARQLANGADSMVESTQRQAYRARAARDCRTQGHPEPDR